MQAHDQSGKKKIQLMNSIMQHPRLSRTLSDAMRAPIGSTKRKHVKSIVSVLNKVYENHDGAGGPGDPTATSTSPFSGMTLSPTGQLSSGTSTPQNTFVIPAAPSPFSQTFSSNFNTGTPSTPATLGGSTNLYSALNTPAKPKTYTLQGPNGITQSSWYPTPGSGLMSLNGPATKMENTAAPIMDAADLVKNGMQFGSGPSFDLDAAIKSGGLTWESGNAPALSNTVDNTTQTGGKPEEQTGSQTTGSQQSGGVSGSYSGGSDIGLSSRTSGASATPWSLEAAAQDAANKNLGGATFAMKVMQDKNLLKQLYPGVPDDQLPIGASLTNQINDLSKMLKSDYHLDSLQSQLTQKINAGVSLPNDIAAYIRGKDQIIGHIDSMLLDVQNKLPELSGGSLIESNAMKNYQNYLLIMKGRANQRYVDFANDSINQFNAQTTAIQNAYNTAKDLYTSEFATKSAARQEDYNRTYSVLTDLYNNISAAPDKEIQRQMLEAQLTAAKQSIITSALQASQIETQNTLAAIGGGAAMASAVYGGLFTAEEASKAYKDAIGNFGDSKGVLNTGQTPADLLHQASLMGQPPGPILFAYVNLLSRKLQSATSFAEIEKYRDQFNALFSEPAVAKQMKDYPSSAFNELKNQTERLLSSAQRNLITSDSNIEKYKSAIENLINTGIFGRFKGINTVDDWIKNNPDIPPSVLRNIYANIETYAKILGPKQAPSEILNMVKTISNGPPEDVATWFSVWNSGVPTKDTTKSSGT